MRSRLAEAAAASDILIAATSMLTTRSVSDLDWPVCDSSCAGHSLPMRALPNPCGRAIRPLLPELSTRPPRLDTRLETRARLLEELNLLGGGLATENVVAVRVTAEPVDDRLVAKLDA